MLPGIIFALRKAGALIFRLGISVAAGFAAGSFTAVAAGLPFFLLEKLAGWRAPGQTAGLVMLAAGVLAAGVAFLHVFRGVSLSPAPKSPRRSLRQRLNVIPGFRQPPWIVPDRVAEDSEEGRALKARLVAIGGQGAHYRDRETGQHWKAVYWEQGFGRGYDLVPISKALTKAPDHRLGERAIDRRGPPPWEHPRPLSTRAGDGDWIAALDARLAPIHRGPHAGALRDRYTGQVWQRVHEEQGDEEGHGRAPVPGTAWSTDRN